jgi:hypothetical protein
VTIPAELAPYLDELLEQVTDVMDLEAAYGIGSAASGGFEPGRSDLDVYAVTGEALEEETKRELVDRIEALDCPARKLEFVLYSRYEASRQNPRFELNLNTGEHVAFTPDTGLPQDGHAGTCSTERPPSDMRSHSWGRPGPTCSRRSRASRSSRRSRSRSGGRSNTIRAGGAPS